MRWVWVSADAIPLGSGHRRPRRTGRAQFGAVDKLGGQTAMDHDIGHGEAAAGLEDAKGFT